MNDREIPADKHSACIALAGAALSASGGEWQAAKAALAEALDVIGAWPHAAARTVRPPRGCATLTVTYERPGASS